MKLWHIKLFFVSVLSMFAVVSCMEPESSQDSGITYETSSGSSTGDSGNGSGPRHDISDIEVNSTSLTTNESGASVSFTILLAKKPSDDVSFEISSSNTAEGIVSPSSVTFTKRDYFYSQTITVTGVDDSVVDGSQSYTISIGAASSSDTDYDGLDPDDLSFVNADND